MTRSVFYFECSTDEGFSYVLEFSGLVLTDRTFQVLVKDRATSTVRATLTLGDGLTLESAAVISAAVAKSAMTAWPRGEYSADLVDTTGGGASRIMAVRFSYDLPGNLVNGVGNRKAFVTWSDNTALVTATGAVGPAGPPGPQGWSPELATVSDGARRVLQVVDWVGGLGTKPDAGDYVGASGLVPLIADAIDIRGPQGLQGDQGDQGEQGIQGIQGQKGWSPQFSLVADGTRRVLRVVGWSGGAGTAPATGDYIGATGLVPAIEDAIDIRGPEGSVVAPGSISTSDLADGILSADADGRSKMEDGFLSADAEGRAKMADGFLSADAAGRNKMDDDFVISAKLAGSALGPRVGVINGKLTTSRSGNAETFAVKTLAGADPTADDPVIFIFQDGAGGYVRRRVTAALSVTASSGSTLGASNGVPFRLWCIAADDAGTIRLGIVKTASGNSVMALNEWGTYSSTAEGGAGAADSAQVIYSATAFTSKYICLIGFSDWDSGLATAGTWNSAPTRTVAFGSGVARPGETLQRRHTLLDSVFASSISGIYTDVTGLSGTITLAAAANLVRAVPRVQGSADTGGSAASFALFRGSVNVGGGIAAGSRLSAFAGWPRTTDTNSCQTATAEIYDSPGAVSAQTYQVKFVLQSGGSIAINRTAADNDLASIGRYSSSLTLEEIMA